MPDEQSAVETPEQPTPQPQMVTVEQALGIAPQGTITEDEIREEDHRQGELRRLVTRWQKFGLALAIERQQEQQAATPVPMAPDTERDLRERIKQLSDVEITLKNENELLQKEVATLRAWKQDRETADTAVEIATGKAAPKKVQA